MKNYVDSTVMPTVNNLGAHVRSDVSGETALRAFDTYFVSEMLKAASRSGDEEGEFAGGKEGLMYRDFLHQELARIVAETTDFGVTQQLRGTIGHDEEVSDASGS